MDWLERMNNVLDYIEKNLDNEISYKKMAQVGCCSEYHLSRMFSSLLVYLSQNILEEDT